MKWIRFFGLALFLSLSLSGIALAQYSSNHYQANQVFFGTGGDNNQSSANYKANVSTGALGVGNYASTHYKVYSGFLTPGEQFLELGIDTATVDMGTVDPASTISGTATFHVRAYLNSDYVVETLSQPPSYTSGAQTHTLSKIPVQASSATGTEQFGINLVGPNNVGSGNFGTNPSPQPDGTYATGVAATGYEQTNKFQYNVGDTIAQTPSGSSGWGLTIYTISYIVNASIITPGGQYSMVQDLIAIPTY